MYLKSQQIGYYLSYLGTSPALMPPSPKELEYVSSCSFGCENPGCSYKHLGSSSSAKGPQSLTLPGSVHSRNHQVLRYGARLPSFLAQNKRKCSIG